MDDGQIRKVIFDVLGSIAPEVTASEIDAAVPLRDQIDLDSMDFLNFIIGLHQKFSVDIPESDYARLTSIDDIVRYLRRQTET